MVAVLVVVVISSRRDDRKQNDTTPVAAQPKTTAYVVSAGGSDPGDRIVVSFKRNWDVTQDNNSYFSYTGNDPDYQLLIDGIDRPDVFVTLEVPELNPEELQRIMFVYGDRRERFGPDGTITISDAEWGDGQRKIDLEYR
jgi:hypothetical protein